jgi:hypothetical protein
LQKVSRKYKAGGTVSIMFSCCWSHQNVGKCILARKDVPYLLFGFAVNKRVDNLPCSHKYVGHMNYEQFT